MKPRLRIGSKSEIALTQEVFDSNLVLDSEQAQGSYIKPWRTLVETSLTALVSSNEKLGVAGLGDLCGSGGDGEATGSPVRRLVL